MKKLALVLVVLLAVSGAAFAEVSVYVGGQAQTAVNVDLDAGGYALTNSLYAEVNLTFGEAIERSGEGDVYGEISVSNLALTITNPITSGDYATVNQALANAESGGHWSEDPVWTAKIIAGDFYVKVDGGEYIRARRDVMANVLDDFSLIGLLHKGAYPSATMAGTLSLGYTMEDMFSIVVKGGTESATAVASNPFGIAADVSVLAVENFNLDLSYVFANTAAAVNGFGATLGYDVAIDTMTLTPYGAFDMDLAGSSWEGGGGLKLAWESDKGGVVNDAAGAWKGFFNNKKTWVDAGADVAVKYTSGNVMDLLVTAAYLPVENLNSAALFEMTNVLGASAMGVGAYADYTVADVKLFGWFKYTTALDLLVGAEYKGIENTTLGVKYTNMMASGTDTMGDVSVYAKVSAW